jgi:hypothetical protein
MAQGDNMPKPFCPSGYVTSQEAVERCASQWFAEKIAEFDAAAAREQAGNANRTNEQPLTPMEVAARALSRTQGISENLQQQIADILIPTENRLRNLLHLGALTASYFGGTFGQGQHAISCEFWATEEADGVLLSGRYWPFGQPRGLFEERPSYPLVFSESELAALLEPRDASIETVRHEICQSEQLRSPARRVGAKGRGIDEAIDDLWPDRIPDGLSAKDRNKKIVEWLAANGHSRPINPERAIQRVLQARRSRGIR